MIPKKTSLTFDEKVKAAYLHYCKGMDIHTIAADIFDGINQGRVAEACKAVRLGLLNGYSHGVDRSENIS